MPNEKPSKKSWSLKDLRVHELNAELRATEFESGAEAEILDADGQVAIASCLKQPIRLIVRGPVGDYGFALNDGSDLETVNDVGAGCGHSMRSGSILIRGHAGSATAAFASGGFVGIHWSAGPRCAVGMLGAEVVVRTQVGAQAAFCMRAGSLVIGGDAGGDLGYGMTGGTIFVRGKVESVSAQLRETRMKDAHSLKLSFLLVRAGIKADPKDFRVYRVRGAAT